MSGDPDLETVFDSIHPGEAEVSQGLPRHSKRSLNIRSGDRVHSVLSEAVRKLALPRLLAAQMAEEKAADTTPSEIKAEDCQRFLALVTSPDQNLTDAFLSVITLRGASRSDILLGLFAPVARMLHEQWLADDVTFADVSLAVGRMQRLLRSPSLPDAPLHFGQKGGSILIVAPPGDPHGFGSAIFEDFFRNADWSTERLLPRTEDELAERVRQVPFDMLSVSVSQDSALAGLALLLRRLRRESANPQLIIMVGGLPLRDDPEVWKRLGADGTAPDAAAALRVANKLLRTILQEDPEGRYALKTV